MEQKNQKIDRFSLEKSKKYIHPSIQGTLKFKIEEKKIDRFYVFKNEFIKEIVIPESELKRLTIVNEG
jgi:hypothetical protein